MYVCVCICACVCMYVVSATMCVYTCMYVRDVLYIIIIPLHVLSSLSSVYPI